MVLQLFLLSLRLLLLLNVILCRKIHIVCYLEIGRNSYDRTQTDMFMLVYLTTAVDV